jgi:hypothetical protein
MAIILSWLTLSRQLLSAAVLNTRIVAVIFFGPKYFPFFSRAMLFLSLKRFDFLCYTVTPTPTAALPFPAVVVSSQSYRQR